MSVADLMTLGRKRSLLLKGGFSWLVFLTPSAHAQVPNPELAELPKSSSSAPVVIEKKPGQSNQGAIIPEGKTLPEGVLRLRVPFKAVTGDHGYDGSGKRTDLGFKLRATAGAFVLEYGVTDRLSTHFLAPIIYRNELALDADKFKGTSTYKDNVDNFVATMAALLVSARPQICGSFEECVKLVESNYALPYDRTVTLPTGEQLTLKRGVPLKSYAHSAVVRAANAKEGKTGLGDIEIGALYAVIPTGPINYSIGGGIRFPTGSFKDVPSSQRGTGRGTVDLGVRQNLDIDVGHGLLLSWQNQSEVMLVKGKKKKTSLVDSDELNAADPTTPLAKAGGSDGKKNEQKFSRKGVRNVGFLKAGYNLSALSANLNFVGVYAQWNYGIDAQERLDGIASGARKQTQSATAGVALSGLPYQVPASVELDYEMPTGGKHVPVASKTLTAMFKTYYRF